MKFDGTEGEMISLNEAAELTRNYRNNFPDRIKGHFFGKEKIMMILNQEEAVGIRVYEGIDEDGGPQLVLVGVSEDCNDLVTGHILDRGIACPPECGIENRLNADL